MNTKLFRYDINGLRAWAVISVVLFHFGVPLVDGGLVGVDVFFVISGFLMTGIIATALERKQFSLLKFYKARAKRIIPALFGLCITLLVVGSIWLPEIDYDQLKAHALSAMGFWSNFQFWQEAGYFDSASQGKWLLHTWSLSVEWQFYLLLPLLLMLAHRLWGNAGIKNLLIVGFFGSLVLSSLAVKPWVEAGYYLLPTRAWEMLAGGLVWWFSVKMQLVPRHPKLMESAGFACIVVSIFLFDDADLWPSYNALLPIIGTMLVMSAQRQNSPFSANPVVQWLGSRSYSIYLWHWPVCVALFYADALQEPLFIVAGLTLSALLGHLSYRLIENGVRLGSNKTTFMLRAATFSAVLAVFLWGYYQQASSNLTEQIELIAKERVNINPRRRECHAPLGLEHPLCQYGGDNIQAIVVGDSHASALTTAVEHALPTTGMGILGRTFSMCPTLFDVKVAKSRTELACGEFNQWLFGQTAAIDSDVPFVVINRGSYYAFGDQQIGHDYYQRPVVYFSEKYETPTEAFLTEFEGKLVDSLCRMADERPVYTVRPIPEMPSHVPDTMSRALTLEMMFGTKPEAISIALEDYHQRHAFIWSAQDKAAQQCDVTILDPLPYLCADGHCAASQNGFPIYQDDDHLSESGNKILVPMFQKVFASKR
ncbi:acyltransferase family protein [Ferrimonas lipolytica]|uniref:Acyltransferase n=1 Tax=Ferrimonas lipolytica TaxID=2724191 RepID=A0A6H1UGW1_9GAMM|nr:acyltransferase family protein [Ferrimonas lipolytica]QIZ78345.1 acyltransferase [Ferrimonas lipolytica]